MITIEHALDDAPINSNARKLYIKSYGCAMNVYDAIRMSEMMQPHGYQLVDTPNEADMVVLNTCHIRDKADEKVFSDIGRMKKVVADDAILAVGGCIGQAMGKKVMHRAPEVRVVFGPQTYHRLPEFVEQVRRTQADPDVKTARVVDTDFPELEKFDKLPEPKSYGPTAFVSIQEGCDKFCTYCVVPYTRGAEISRPMLDILAEVKTLVAQGTKEITFLGQNVNAYESVDENGEKVSFAKFLTRMAQIENLQRIRFTTSHPNNMTNELIQLYGTEEKLMPYMHFPVQAGSNKILQAMNRNHTMEEYLEICAKLKTVRPDIAISGDFIVGFPGETEDDFVQTLATAAQVGYSQAYSFAYSPRPGTPAANMTNQIEKPVQMERLAGLQALLENEQYKYNEQFVGQTLEVLVEERGTKSKQLRGRSPHNVNVNFEGNDRLIGEMVRVTITEARTRSLLGKIELVSE